MENKKLYCTDGQLCSKDNCTEEFQRCRHDKSYSLLRFSSSNEFLVKEIELLRKNGWKNFMEESPPDGHKKYLVVYNIGYRYTGQKRLQKACGVKKVLHAFWGNDKKWHMPYNSMNPSRVTHWMPFPSPPDD